MGKWVSWRASVGRRWKECWERQDLLQWFDRALLLRHPLNLEEHLAQEVCFLLDFVVYGVEAFHQPNLHMIRDSAGVKSGCFFGDDCLNFDSK